MTIDLTAPKLRAGDFNEYLALIFQNRINQTSGDHDLEDYPDLKEYYLQNLESHVEKYENSRIETLQEIRNRSLKALKSGVLFLCLLIPVQLFSFEQMRGFLFVIGVLCLAFFSWWISRPVVAYQRTLKNHIYPLIFKFFGPSFIFASRSPVSVESLKNSLIIPDHNSHRTEDYIKGNLEGVDIELFEAKLSVKRNKKSETVFDGLFIRLGMNKNFTGQTVITKDTSYVGNWMRGKIFDLEQVRLEDPKFEGQFEVYSSDQVEARYLLSTTFMEQLVELKALFKNAKIQCSFYENKLLISIPYEKDLFEPGSIFHPTSFTRDLKTVYQEMQIIRKIIEVLKLNKRTGL